MSLHQNLPNFFDQIIFVILDRFHKLLVVKASEKVSFEIAWFLTNDVLFSYIYLLVFLLFETLEQHELNDVKSALVLFFEPLKPFDNLGTVVSTSHKLVSAVLFKIVCEDFIRLILLQSW